MLPKQHHWKGSRWKVQQTMPSCLQKTIPWFIFTIHLTSNVLLHFENYKGNRCLFLFNIEIPTYMLLLYQTRAAGGFYAVATCEADQEDWAICWTYWWLAEYIARANFCHFYLTNLMVCLCRSTERRCSAESERQGETWGKNRCGASIFLRLSQWIKGLLWLIQRWLLEQYKG